MCQEACRKCIRNGEISRRVFLRKQVERRCAGARELVMTGEDRGVDSPRAGRYPASRKEARSGWARWASGR